MLLPSNYHNGQDPLDYHVKSTLNCPLNVGGKIDCVHPNCLTMIEICNLKP